MIYTKQDIIEAIGLLFVSHTRLGNETGHSQHHIITSFLSMMHILGIDPKNVKEGIKWGIKEFFQETPQTCSSQSSEETQH